MGAFGVYFGGEAAKINSKKFLSRIDVIQLISSNG
jgi:hypothetical protein